MQTLQTPRKSFAWVLGLPENKSFKPTELATMSSWPKWCAKPTVFSVCAGHTSSVNALAFKQGEGLSGRDIIFSGSGDESIRVWDMTSGKCEGELHGHAGYVSSMVLQDEYLVSASYDSTLCLWSANRRTLIKQIKAHEHCVNALMAHESGVLLSASWDGTVRVWDLRVDSTSQTRSYASFLVVYALCSLNNAHVLPVATPTCSDASQTLGAGSGRGPVPRERGPSRVLRPA